MINKLKKKNSFSCILIFIIAILVCVLVCLVVFRIKVANIGSGLGNSAGIASGKLSGSIEGLAEAREAYEEGKVKGLSAEDTVADIANAIQKVENLEVLVASVKLNDIHKVGDDYAALYLLKGDVVFTVDLGKSTLEESGNDVYITIPQPEAKLVLDQSKIERAAEYQKHFFSGSAEAGFDAYINHMKQIAEKPLEKIENYEILMKTARESAQKQVNALAEATLLNNKRVYVEFQEKEVSE